MTAIPVRVPAGVWRAQIEAQQIEQDRQIADLTSRLVALEPQPDPHRVLIGASVPTTPTWLGNWLNLQRAIGNLQAVRLFDPTAGAPPATLFRNVAGKGLEIHSSTKSLSTDVWARSAYYEAVKATGENVVAYTWHEMIDDIDRGVFTYGEWREAAMTDAAACYDFGVTYGVCFQLFDARERMQYVEMLAADTELLALVDVIGIDAYQRSDTAFHQAEWHPWSYQGEKITEVAGMFPGKAIVLPEFGVPEHPTDAAYRTTYLMEMHAQAVREGWRAVLAYNSYRVPDDPGDNWASTGPEFLFDTIECREASRAAMAGLVALGGAP